MSSSAGAEASRVLIPKNAMTTIQTIRDTTGKKHSDEEIYAVLKECDMDPNETVEKLLHIDTFHEVKKKPNRQNRMKEAAVVQQRGTRGARRNYSSNFKASDVGGGRNAPARRENGNYHPRDRGSLSSSVSQKEKNNAVAPMEKSPTAVSNGSANLSNGSSSHASKMPSGDSKSTKDAVPASLKQSSTHTAAVTVEESPKSVLSGTSPSIIGDQEKSLPSSNLSSTSSTVSVSGIYSSASDPVVDGSLHPRAGVVGAIEPVVSRQQEVAEINLMNGEEAISSVPDLVLSENAAGSSKATEQIESSAPLEPSPPKAITSKVATDIGQDEAKLLPRSNASDGQHVTFPTHFQVSDVLKTGLTFGSFDPSFGLGNNQNNGSTDTETTQTQAVESIQGSDETAGEPSPSNQSVTSTEQGDTAERPQTPPMFEKVPQSDSNIQSTVDLKNIQSIEELKLQAESNPRHNVQNGPNHNIGFMPPLSTSHFVQFDGPEIQARDVPRFSNFTNGSPPAPSSSPAPLLPSSVATPPQAVPLFRHPFHPSYFPYGPYISPFLMPPMHQFISPNGLPQQPSTGSVYLPPPGPPASGFKLPLPQFKTGTNTGSATHISIPSAYGPFNSPHVGFNPIPAATSAGSTSKDDIAASQLKESHVYTTGPVTEGPALWMASPGQDISNLPLSSLYNFSHHGLPVAFSPAQAAHGAFAGLYQTPQTMAAAPSNINSLLQPSQPVAAAASEAVGPPPNAYQQPQLAAHWNTSY